MLYKTFLWLAFFSTQMYSCDVTVIRDVIFNRKPKDESNHPEIVVRGEPKLAQDHLLFY